MSEDLGRVCLFTVFVVVGGAGEGCSLLQIVEIDRLVLIECAHTVDELFVIIFELVNNVLYFAVLDIRGGTLRYSDHLTVVWHWIHALAQGCDSGLRR